MSALLEHHAAPAGAPQTWLEKTLPQPAMRREIPGLAPAAVLTTDGTAVAKAMVEKRASESMLVALFKEDKPMKRYRVMRAVAVLGLAGTWFLSLPLAADAQNSTSGIVSGKTDQGDAFMTGGVGTEEREQMQQQARSYDLDLSFADATGHYLSDVKVAITDEHGNPILNTTTAGPFLYAELPTGKYDVKANFNGHIEQIRNLDVSKNHPLTRLMHWQVTDHATAKAKS